jgi:hypothetical protein
MVFEPSSAVLLMLPSITNTRSNICSAEMVVSTVTKKTLGLRSGSVTEKN